MPAVTALVTWRSAVVPVQPCGTGPLNEWPAGLINIMRKRERKSKGTHTHDCAYARTCTTPSEQAEHKQGTSARQQGTSASRAQAGHKRRAAQHKRRAAGHKRRAAHKQGHKQGRSTSRAQAQAGHKHEGL